MSGWTDVTDHVLEPGGHTVEIHLGEDVVWQDETAGQTWPPVETRTSR